MGFGRSLRLGCLRSRECHRAVRPELAGRRPSTRDLVGQGSAQPTA